MFRRIVLAGALALAASTSHAAFSYDFVEAGAGEVDEGDALFVNASKSINPNLFVLGSAYMVDSGVAIPGYDGEGFYLEGGLGYAMPMAPEVDVFASAQVLYGNVDVPGDDDDLGYMTRLGLRYTPVSRMELEASAAYSANDLLIEDGVGITGAARYQVTPAFSAAIGYTQDTELDGAFFNVRYNFQ
ncbi:MAG: hypothetical protein V4729_04600 [Pseudomonadota bacterium]